MISSAMMEKMAFSSSRLRVFYFLMYSAATSITSLWMILGVYCAFFLPVSRCSRSASSRLAIIARIAQKFTLLDGVLVRSSLWPLRGKFVFHKIQLFRQCSSGRERFSCTSLIN